jgi:uncharacterized membrane protein YccC
MVKESKFENQSGVDKGLVAMFLRMSPEERLQTNDNALRAILELRNAFRQLIQLKRASRDPKDRQRLPILEETLRQLEGEFGNGQDNDK